LFAGPVAVSSAVSDSDVVVAGGSGCVVVVEVSAVEVVEVEVVEVEVVEVEVVEVEVVEVEVVEVEAVDVEVVDVEDVSVKVVVDEAVTDIFVVFKAGVEKYDGVIVGDSDMAKTLVRDVTVLFQALLDELIGSTGMVIVEVCRVVAVAVVAVFIPEEAPHEIESVV
jgi:hypothetical protein